MAKLELNKLSRAQLQGLCKEFKDEKSAHNKISGYKNCTSKSATLIAVLEIIGEDKVKKSSFYKNNISSNPVSPKQGSPIKQKSISIDSTRHCIHKRCNTGKCILDTGNCVSVETQQKKYPVSYEYNDQVIYASSKDRLKKDFIDISKAKSSPPKAKSSPPKAKSSPPKAKSSPPKAKSSPPKAKSPSKFKKIVV